MLRRFVQGFGGLAKSSGFVKSAGLPKSVGRWSAGNWPIVSGGQRRMLSLQVLESPHVFDMTYESDWDDMLADNPKPVVVVFYTEWCPNSQKLMPKLLDQIKRKNGEVTLFRVNIDKHKDLMSEIKLPGIPTCMLMRFNEVVDSFNGDVDEKKLEDFFEPYEMGKK
jgi:thioredoxin 1